MNKLEPVVAEPLLQKLWVPPIVYLPTQCPVYKYIDKFIQIIRIK